MGNKNMISKEIIKGSLRFFILNTLTKGEDYGYGIVQSIKQVSKDLLEPTEGSLYPALYKLEDEGYIASRWDDNFTPKRKYYYLTSKGKKLLEKENSDWKSMTDLINTFLATK